MEGGVLPGQALGGEGLGLCSGDSVLPAAGHPVPYRLAAVARRGPTRVSLGRTQQADDLSVLATDDHHHAPVVDGLDAVEPLVVAGDHGGHERLDVGDVAGDRVGRADAVAAVGAGDPSVVEGQLAVAGGVDVNPASGELQTR